MRLPADIYVAYRRAALKRGMGYQTQIFEILREAMSLAEVACGH